MSKESALERYTKAVEKRNEHIKANKTVFEEHERIVGAVIDAENDLRDEVAEANAGVENTDFKVIITPQTQRVYNEDKMKQILTPIQFADIVNDVTRPPKISIRPVSN